MFVCQGLMYTPWDYCIFEDQGEQALLSLHVTLSQFSFAHDHSVSLFRFATYVEKLVSMATAMGLQMNYNSAIAKLTEAQDGSFTLTTADGRVTPSSHWDVPDFISGRQLSFSSVFYLSSSAWLA